MKNETEANDVDAPDTNQTRRSAHCSVAYWDEVWQVVEAINDSPAEVRFLDGQQMTGQEGWRAAILRVRSRLAELRAKAPKNLMVCKELPWMCGECDTESVRSLRIADNGDLVAKCEKCGTEWVSQQNFSGNRVAAERLGLQN